jgi:hypothetical protein
VALPIRNQITTGGFWLRAHRSAKSSSSVTIAASFSRGVLPNGSVFGLSQPDLPNGYRVASRLPQRGGKRGRKLGIDDELHAACSTA